MTLPPLRTREWDLDLWDYVLWGAFVAVMAVAAYAYDWQARHWDGWSEVLVGGGGCLFLAAGYVGRRVADGFREGVIQGRGKQDGSQ